MQKSVNDLILANKKAFLIGIGGVGMSGLARILAARGLQVSGSDAKRSKTTSKLEKEGIAVEVGHRGDFKERPDFIVFSSAIQETNPDLLSARASGIPTFHRAEVLSSIINPGISAVVTGTHGKSTTSALTSFLMTEAGLRPTCAVGGEMLNFGSNVVLGHSHFFVVEVDESDRSHLRFSPDVALITGIEAEHLNVYKDFEDLKHSFQCFIEKVQKTGQTIYCADDLGIKEVVKEHPVKATTYGLSATADFCATDIELNGFTSTYDLHERGRKIDTVSLKVPGQHNVVNSLGAIAILRHFGVGYNRLLRPLSEFRGVGRRLEVKLNRPDILVIDDYAHHPTEIVASLSAIQGLRKKMTVFFQPHRFTRTAQFAKEFAQSFYLADRVFVTEIYGAGEENTAQVSSEMICEAVGQNRHPEIQTIKRSEIISFLSSQSTEEETIVFMGAGDIGDIADEFAGQFEGAYLH